MYCKNCGNDVNDKAIACPKCGVNPRLEKNFCQGCGEATNPNQSICIKCGVSLKSESFVLDTSSLANIDASALLKNKELVFAVVALIGYFLPWISISSYKLSGSGIQSISGGADGILALMPLLFLFPLSLVGIIISNFVPQILKFKKILTISSIVLVCYGLLSIIMFMNNFGGFEFTGIGFGLYLSFIGTIASAKFSLKQA